jgi:hypothetical protein
LTDEAIAAPEAPAADVTPTPEAAPSEPVSLETRVDTDLRAVWDKLHPARQSNGQFTAKEQETPDDETPVVEDADQPEEAKGEQETPAIDPPLSWSAELKAKWASVPPDVRQYVAARDRETHEAITRQGQVIKSFEPLTNTLEQFRDVYESYNLRPDQALQYLFSAERQLRVNPQAALRDLCAAYKVDPLDLTGEGQPQQHQQSDPRVAQLEAELYQIRSTLYSQQQAEQQNRAASIEREIAEFAKDKPHFQAMQDDIMDQIRAIKHRTPDMAPGEVLAKAYERAVKVNPAVSAQIEAEAKKAADERRAKEAEEKTKAAKRSASVNLKGSPGHNSKRTSFENDDATLREIWNRNHA